MKIDKSKFTPEELKQYEALIAKALVDGKEKPKPDPVPEKPDIGEKGGEGKESEGCAKKSLPAPELTAALERLERLEKVFEMSKCAEVAKKYALLGDDEDELAKNLYNLKKADEASYKAYIAALDKSLELVQKSGLFTEIGKTGTGTSGGTVIDKIKAAASDIQKADPSLNRTAAIAKAWENHPELVQEYDAEYSAK